MTSSLLTAFRRYKPFEALVTTYGGEGLPLAQAASLPAPAVVQVFWPTEGYQEGGLTLQEALARGREGLLRRAVTFQEGKRSRRSLPLPWASSGERSPAFQKLLEAREEAFALHGYWLRRELLGDPLLGRAQGAARDQALATVIALDRLVAASYLGLTPGHEGWPQEKDEAYRLVTHREA